MGCSAGPPQQSAMKLDSLLRPWGRQTELAGARLVMVLLVGMVTASPGATRLKGTAAQLPGTLWQVPTPRQQRWVQCRAPRACK